MDHPGVAGGRGVVAAGCREIQSSVSFINQVYVFNTVTPGLRAGLFLDLF